jgi:signal recognition particle receptor subunit beta
MFINYARQEINLKVVYYGPGLSGKTTNLEFIFKNIDPKLRSDLVTLNTREERTLYFDFMQLEFAPIKGKKPKFNLYTVPGQVYYNFSRKIILRGVDGVVFVADSQKSRMDENLESLLDLEKNLIEMGESLQTVPWVIQYNKRDLNDIETIEAMESKLNFFGVPYYESVANTGVAVFPTLQKVLTEVIANVQKQMT